MKMNKENYPAYFLDFYEGRLSAADEAALFDFLAMHPDLQEAFEAFELVSLSSSSWDGTVPFPDKGSLKRGVITPENRDYYFAAYAEGDLSEEERRAVEAFAAADPAMARELAIMQKAFLPDEPVNFPNKSSLKRHVVAPAEQGVVIAMFMKHWMPQVAAAAVLMLLAGLFFLRQPAEPLYEYAQDMPPTQEIPAAGGADDPVAVADIPLWLREGEISAERRAQSVEQGGTGEISAERRAGSVEQGGTGEISAERRARSVEQRGRMLVADGVPDLQRAGGIGAERVQFTVAQAARPELDYRTEFAYWSPQSLPDDFFRDDPVHESGASYGQQQTGLAQLAMNRLGQTLPIDFNKAEDHIRENRFPIWVVAEAGLTGLGNFATNALGIQRETDQEGRTIAISAGERFEARRSNR